MQIGQFCVPILAMTMKQMDNKPIYQNLIEVTLFFISFQLNNQQKEIIHVCIFNIFIIYD